MKKFSLVALVSTLLPIICLAHDGHGTTGGFTITHYFAEPEHAFYSLGVLLAGLAFFSFYKLSKRKSA